MWRGASAACLLLGAIGTEAARSQTIDAFRPVRDGFLAPQESPLRRTAVSGLSDAAPTPGLPAAPAPISSAARRTQVPLPGVPAASGAADVGYDSLNRNRRKPKYYPAQARPKPPAGPGTPPAGELTGQLRPTLPPSASASRPPVAAAIAGTVPGQPPRKRLRIDDDPFGAVGDYAGPFLVKAAVELSAGYDSNPARLANARGMPVWMVAPEFLAVSNWERHAMVADLRGSFTGYGSTLPAIMDGGINSAPTTLDRPDFTGHVDGRLDVSRDTSVGAQLRLRAATDNPGSPSVQAGLARYPVYTTLGTTVGVDQRFNRLQLSAGATADRTSYQQSKLTDGTMTSNDDRNFNQYGGIGRASYEIMPGLKPFAEIQGDTRVHDEQFDRSRYQRDSSGGYAKAGTSFEFTRLLTGEVSIGYAARNYVDPRLNRLQGFLTTASLVWSATPLTTARFLSDTQLAETTVAGASGVLVRTYTVQVDHDFRRWLTGIGKFTFGTLDYQGYGRSDRTYSAEGNLVYKMTRNLWVKGSLRYDKLDSNITGAGSSGTVVMLGVRLQN
ncbi:outer membrane beta-barrel protein [Bradyrhizobium ontarionense]|uniref:Outer membrane beta-barrel protein n=2 Tax=Bradyrhizobium ontarionense TaxID=2898149 RepID=A0ABY3R9F7_9BRAD|nr:outer membrane beta-barrel protein [Bradyrhizobium sp. A19]UFZ03397.1 outer membrane beta-barrel protein [Bradyrhizobium sp. A19]